MGGKKGVSAKEKAATKEKEAAAQQARAREDAEWVAAGEGKKSKAQARRAAQDEAKQESAAKKLEAKRLAEAEAAEAGTIGKKGGGASRKVTQYELDRRKEQDAKAREAAAAARDVAGRREVAAEDYGRMMDTQVDNENAGARNVDDALALLGVQDEPPRMKFSEYSARELPILRADKPGLKMPQYKDIIWKKWQRSPENPMNQANA